MGDPAQVVTISDTGPVAKSQQVTGFIDDAADRPSSLPHIRRPENSAIGSSLETRVHSIVDVLSRPVLLTSDTWSDSQIRDDIVFKADFPDDLFNTSSNLEDKLNYFAFLRADVCIRIMVNANTFQQGKLLGYFTPFDPLVGNRNVASDFTSSYTVFPHVLVDASVGNSADLCIPYVSPYSSYRLTDNIGNIGTFYLNVLNPLKSGQCTFSVYAWFTNISVDMPSGKENSLSASSQFLSGLRRAVKKLGVDKVKESFPNISDFKGQVAGEDEQKSSGIISSTAHTISQVADSVSGIPILADIAAPISWVSKAIAGVAEYFGYSKSQNLSTPTRYANVPGYGWTNASGVDSSVVLGCTQDNSIEPRGDMFGSGADDMEITYICKHKCYVDSFTFASNQAPGELLYSFPVTPGWCQFENEVYQPTATAFIASIFNYWRGGLKYKIQAAKTAYHSGRIRIVYLPGSSTSEVDDAEQAYNWVLDLRNSSEIEFVVPYNNILEWSESRLSSGVGAVGSIGTIRIEVLNELRRPDSVSADIEFNVWIAGESDLQFAVPTFQNYVPSLPDVGEPLANTVASKDPVLNTIGLLGGLSGLPSEFSRRALGMPEVETEYEGQVLGNFQDTGFNDMSDKSPMFRMSGNDMVSPCKMSIGEYVPNLRYLTRRFGIVQTKATSTEDLYVELPSYYFTRVFNPANDNLATYQISPVDYISWLYRFFRGGIRWKFLATSNGLDQGFQEAVLVNDFESSRTITDVTETVFNSIFVAAQSFWHRVYTILNPVLEITVPYYSQTPVRPIVGGDTKQPKLLDDNAVLYHSHITGGSGSVNILKAAHDDFSFGWLVGPPKLRPRARPFLTASSPATGVGESGNFIDFIGVSVTPADRENGTYNILSASPATIEITYTDMTTAIASFDTGGVTKGASTSNIRVLNPDTSKDVDSAATLATFNATTSYTFLVSGPF